MNRAEGAALGEELRHAFDEAGISIDALAERTKVPRSTIRALIGDDIAVVLPPRIYLRGHLGLLVREIGLDVEEWLRKFDAANPVVDDEPYERDLPRIKTSTVAIAAGLGGVGILAVILSFVG